MINPIIIHSMKTNHPWNDYSGILFYKVFVMNRKEWKAFCLLDRHKAYYWYNKVRRFLKSKEYESLENCDNSAKVIHHLRDTEEQRKYNDTHYELFGFEIDENGNESFEYGKYVVFWTKEHHSEYHRLSEETRKKMSASNKGRHVSEETRKKLSEANKGKCIPDDQRKQISESVSNLWKSEEYRSRQSKATKEAMWRPDVRQRLLDGCKKRPPISKEARKRVGELNRAKQVSDKDISEFINYFTNNTLNNAPLNIKELSCIYNLYKESYNISWNTFQKLYKNVKSILLQKGSI